MKNKFKIVFITDLEHSAPRISNFIHYLKKQEDFDISLIGSDYNSFLNKQDLPENFTDGFKQFLFKRKINLMKKLRRYYYSEKKHSKKHVNTNNLSHNSIFKNSLKNIIVFIKSLLVNFYLRLNFPDQYVYTSFKYLKLYTKNINSSETVIISSSPYPTSHIAAYLIKNRYPDVKWIADYRDMWSFNHNYSFGLLRNYMDFKLEKSIIKKCNLITTVSNPWAKKLSQAFSKKTFVIRNGFSVYNDSSETCLLSMNSNKIFFLYVGTISFKIHDLKMFFEGVSTHLKSNNNVNIEIHFCGNYSDKLDVIIKKYNLEKFVKQIGRFSRKETNMLQKKYDYLFYFDCIADPGVLLLKFYEYINACRPILAFGNNSDSESAKIINNLNRGIYFKNSSLFTSFLNDLNNKSFKFDLNEKNNKTHSYEYQSKKLIELIRKNYD